MMQTFTDLDAQHITATSTRATTNCSSTSSKPTTNDEEPDKVKQCPSCPYSTFRTSHMKRHMLSHTGEKPFPCPLCPHRSLQNADLQKHLLTHTGEKPYQCAQCDYRATQKIHLTLHVARIHGNPQGR